MPPFIVEVTRAVVQGVATGVATDWVRQRLGGARRAAVAIVRAPVAPLPPPTATPRLRPFLRSLPVVPPIGRRVR